ncbi:MAG TPA: prolyl oligopeptidase family serine peptidase, partial [Chryseosolibacter sp.]|nr:prolyl oligopeptidase family serine peptidase [Chryseosolibacter sp.]
MVSTNPYLIHARIFVIFILILCLANAPSRAQDDLDVIQGKWLHFTDAGNSLYHHFAEQAYGHLEARKKLIGKIQSLDEWKFRQQSIRKTLLEVIGPFPEKTPLNAKITRTVSKNGYRIEHIVYESRPQFFVTASLYVPSSLKRKDRAPTIIYCSGHSDNGYRSKVYQNVIVNLVRKGFVVFAFDPVGQGERLQYFDSGTGKSLVGGPTSEHSYPGSQAFVAGTSQANYMIWDGIRAVDYLLTRKEVDPARIGITGRSGGGTQSSYIAAVDDRIHAAAPECYITSFERLLQSIGPQDAEQNFPQGISKGLDHADLLEVRAPKPTLMITTTRDMFSIQGARETAAEVARIYHAYGKGDHFAMVEDDAPHASTKRNREAMYTFFQKHLNNPGTSIDEEVDIPTEAELMVTTSGQVLTSLGGETGHSLNQRYLQQKTDALRVARAKTNHLEQVIDDAKTLSGYRPSPQHSSPVFTGRLQRDGYTIEKYFIKGEGEYVVPYLLIAPENENGRTILYLHPDAKNAEATTGGEIESLVKKGFTVLAPDLVGTGETGAGDFKGDAYIGGVSHNVWYAGILIGR